MAIYNPLTSELVAKERWMNAINVGADTIVTGESGYNKSLDAGEDGMNVFIAGHYYTEAPVMKILEDLAKSIAGAETELYTKAPELFF